MPKLKAQCERRVEIPQSRSVPCRMYTNFIESSKTAAGANGHIGWNAWVKRYEADYVVYDNAAIHRAR